MIDNVSVLLSTVVCLIVVFQAVKLDRILPWFRSPPPPAAERPGLRRLATATGRGMAPGRTRPPSARG